MSTRPDTETALKKWVIYAALSPWGLEGSLNKIQWLDWGKESFEKAQATGKPILLDIFGSWCHWCHVMEETSYSDPPIVDTVNKHFIPVRVNTDKRPDVNRRYNMGGWPTTAFLDSDGRVITGATYIPPQQLRDVLRSVLDYYSKNKGKVRSKVVPVRIPKATGDAVTEKIAKDISTTIAVNFDIDYGGFGFEPKFPHTDALDLALLRFKYHGEKEMLTVVNRTLEKMSQGGMYDQVEGGFFRYSTTRDWSIPHFEKMAEDNARLLGVYLRAYQVTENTSYRGIVEGILNYVTANLSDEQNGGFYGSQDADEEYYKLDPSGRDKLQHPSVDKTFYANYNSLFVSSYLLASEVLGKPELAKFGLRSLDRLLQHVSREAGPVHYWGPEDSELRGLLVDCAWLLHALIDAYEYTAKRSYVEQSIGLAEFSIKALYDEQGAGFYDTPDSESQVGELRSRDKPLDENSTMALALLRLSWITGNERYGTMASKTLEVFANSYERQGLMAAGYGISIDLQVNGPVGVTIVGPQKGKNFEAFKMGALTLFAGRRDVLYLDPSKDSERINQLGYDTSVEMKAYVCVGKVCGPPVKDPSQLGPTLFSLIKPANAQIIS